MGWAWRTCDFTLLQMGWQRLVLGSLLICLIQPPKVRLQKLEITYLIHMEKKKIHFLLLYSFYLSFSSSFLPFSSYEVFVPC